MHDQIATCDALSVRDITVTCEAVECAPRPDGPWRMLVPEHKRTLRLDLDWWPASGVTHRSAQLRRKI